MTAIKQAFPGDKPTGKTRRFVVSIIRTAELVLDESVIVQGLANDGYMKNPTEDEVLQHLAYNLLGNELRLSLIDGYANCPNESARVEKIVNDDIAIYELPFFDKTKRPKARKKTR